MITGKITISSRPSEDELKTGICSSCCREVEEVPVDESYDDQFGLVEIWGKGSPCCDAEVCQGRIFLDQTSIHVARKDHVNKKGIVIVRAGQRYKKHIRKGYMVDENGQHSGFFFISKKVIP